MNINLIVYVSIIIGLCNCVLLSTQVYPQEITSSDFTGLDEGISSTAKLIADDIGLYNETEIKDYSLTDLPAEDILAVFNIVNIANLSKVLVNIQEEELNDIKNKISEEFDNILTRLSEENQTKVKERINNPKIFFKFID